MEKELKNKIKDINTYWKNLELTYQTELKRREEEYEKNEKENKKTNEHIYPFLSKLFFYLKCKNFMYDDFLNYYETYFHCVNYNTGEI